MPSADKLARPVPICKIIQENFEGLERKNLEEVIAKTQREVMGLLRKTVRPEFLNRLVKSHALLSLPQIHYFAHHRSPCLPQITTHLSPSP